jgi:hypothetical protein
MLYSMISVGESSVADFISLPSKFENAIHTTQRKHNVLPKYLCISTKFKNGVGGIVP